jgi:hypothetical protein
MNIRYVSVIRKEHYTSQIMLYFVRGQETGNPYGGISNIKQIYNKENSVHVLIRMENGENSICRR